MKSQQNETMTLSNAAQAAEIRCQLRATLMERLKPLARQPGPTSDQVGPIQGMGENIGDYRNLVATNRGTELWSIFYDLVRAGIIVPGKVGVVNAVGTRYRLQNAPAELLGFPSFALTEFGRQVLLNEDAGPLEGQAYVASIKRRMPDAGEVVVQYIAEAAGSFADGRYLASSVLLGVAAEELARRLYQSLCEHMSSDQARSFSEALNKRRGSAQQQFDEYMRRLAAHANELNEEFRRRIESQLSMLVGLLKVSRDDAGHARPARIDRDIAHLNLIGFPILVGMVAEMDAAMKAPCART